MRLIKDDIGLILPKYSCLVRSDSLGEFENKEIYASIVSIERRVSSVIELEFVYHVEFDVRHDRIINR